MIGTALAFVLACPPTAEPAAAPRGDYFIFGSGSELLHWRPDPDKLPIALEQAPELPDLPLWDPIAIESARRWTALAKHLRRKARITPTDIAALALLAELELAAHTDDYEALLIAAPPSDQPSAKAMRAFEDTYARCRMAQHNLHRDLLDIEANLSARVLLREALHLHAHARLFDEHHQFEARAQRRRANEARKFAPWRLHTIASSLLDGAADLAEHCVAIGTDAELLAACESILVLDPPPLHELVPEPRSTSVMRSPGVVGPELL